MTLKQNSTTSVRYCISHQATRSCLPLILVSSTGDNMDLNVQCQAVESVHFVGYCSLVSPAMLTSSNHQISSMKHHEQLMNHHSPSINQQDHLQRTIRYPIIELDTPASGCNLQVTWHDTHCCSHWLAIDRASLERCGWSIARCGSKFNDLCDYCH